MFFGDQNHQAQCYMMHKDHKSRMNRGDTEVWIYCPLVQQICHYSGKILDQSVCLGQLKHQYSLTLSCKVTFLGEKIMA